MSQDAAQYKSTVTRTISGVATAECSECRAQFTQTRGNQKFCTEKCRANNWAKANRPKPQEQGFTLTTEDAKAAALVAVSILPVGEHGWEVLIERHKKRNYKFHKKLFALLDIGFDAFEPPTQEYKGLPVQKNFKRFRKDVTIAAGFYEAVADINGNVRLEAKSISFAKMEENEFEQLYSKVADVLLQKVLKNYTRPDLDRVVNNILGMV